jgi:hypothetical protein
MRTDFSLAACFVTSLAFCVGCSSSSPASSPSNDGGVSDDAASVDGGTIVDGAAPADDIDLDAESANVAAHGESATSTASAKATTELFVHEDPTLDMTKSAGQNADAVAAQLTTSVAPCANAKVTHTTGNVGVSVTFGTDCTIGGVAYSGTVAATLSGGATGLTVAFTFTNLDVNGTTMNGTASETTTDATTFSSSVDLTIDTTHVTYKGSLALDSNDLGVTLNGSGTYQKGSEPSTNYSASGVHHTFGACYADAGSMSYTTTTIGKSGKSYSVIETITFSSTTPSTGKASATIGSTATTVTLPTYGTCPHS